MFIDSPSLQSRINSGLRAEYLSSLPAFIRAAWPLVEPSTPFSWNWHLDEICSILEAVTEGHIKKLIINIPPGCSKSLTVSVFWPAWEWARHPEYRYLTFSYSDANTIRDNLRVRDIITSEWYRALFWEHEDQTPKVVLSSDQNAKIRFNNTAKGWRVASSVDGKGTGEHPHRIILDDLLKAQDARSDIMVDNVNNWLQGTVSSRVALDPAIVLIMQRLHERDASKFLLDKGGWSHVCFPMRYHVPYQEVQSDNSVRWMNGWDCPCHESRADVLDMRTEEGQLLWPELWPSEKVEDEEIMLGPIESSGQLDQRPSPPGGTLLTRDMFEIVDSLPPGPASRCRGWDTADTDITSKKAKRSDWTVGVRMARIGPIFYVEHVIRIKGDSGKVDLLILDTALEDGKQVKIREGSGSGKATIHARTQSLAGWDYDASPETEDKIARSAPFRAQAKRGNIKLLRGPWNSAYLDVLTTFPVGAHDDDVDATSNAFNELTEKPVSRVGLSLARRLR